VYLACSKKLTGSQLSLPHGKCMIEAIRRTVCKMFQKVRLAFWHYY